MGERRHQLDLQEKFTSCELLAKGDPGTPSPQTSQEIAKAIGYHFHLKVSNYC